MDKKKLNPTKLCGLALFSLFLLILAGGCNTVKGAAQGAGKDIKSMQDADQEFRKVLW